MQRMLTWFGEVDSRPIGFFRIMWSLLLLKDAIYHLPLATIFYSDAGVSPLSVLRGGFREHRFSLMDALPYSWMATLFFLLWIVVLLCLMVGWRARLMAILNFILIASIYERNTYIADGADGVMRIMSFWLIFLPLADYYSIDAIRKRRAEYHLTRDVGRLRVPPKRPLAYAFPIKIAQIQVALVYIFTFILKLPGKPWTEGKAVHYALQVTTFTLPTGDWLAQHSPIAIIEILTYGTLFAEGAFAIFVFFPFWQPWLRIVGLALVTGLHLGIAVTMSIPNFSVVMITTYILFFEPEWVAWLDAKLRLRRRPVAIGAPTSTSPLWWPLTVTRADEIQLIDSVQSAPERYDSWEVLDEAGNPHVGKEAWQAVIAHLPLSRLWGWVLKFEMIRRGAWWIMGRGPWMPYPEADTPPMPRRPWKVGRLALTLLLGTLMFFVIWWNLRGVQQDNQPIIRDVPAAPKAVIEYLSLRQNWGMFAPYPVMFDGWMTIPGRFEDDSELDLFTSKPPTDEMLRWYWGPNLRWKKYIENLRRSENEHLLMPFGAYYCRVYNIDQARPKGERLATLELHYMGRDSVLPGETSLSHTRYLMWRHWCYDEYRY